jgi:hypothetical protein
MNRGSYIRLCVMILRLCAVILCSGSSGFQLLRAQLTRQERVRTDAARLTKQQTRKNTETARDVSRANLSMNGSNQYAM